MSDADRVRGMIAMCDGLARMSSDNGPVREEWVATSAALTALLDDARRVEHLQAKVDALMLEYCPDEMTDEQMANWTAAQGAVQEPRG